MKTNPNYMMGLAALLLDGESLGYVEKGSFDLGGKKGEVYEIEAEQAPDDPVEYIPIKNAKIAPTFNLIELQYERLHKCLGGSLIEGKVGEDTKVIGWKAPTSLVKIEGNFTIKFFTGREINIPRAALLSNLGGKVALTETTKLECELKTLKSENGSSYSIDDETSIG